jgi:hypothetical protein
MSELDCHWNAADLRVNLWFQLARQESLHLLCMPVHLVRHGAAAVVVRSAVDRAATAEGSVAFAGQKIKAGLTGEACCAVSSPVRVRRLPLPGRSDRGLDVPAQWTFCDDGHSGATLVRPALEQLRDLVAQVPVEVVLVYSPDRLAWKYAYQAVLIEEFAKAGSSASTATRWPTVTPA